MNNIEGQIRQIKTSTISEVFYDFEFLGESDESTIGLVCLTRCEQPNVLVVTEMNKNELSIPDYKIGMKVLIERTAKETGYKDLVFPTIIRYEQKQNDSNKGFQEYLKTYQKPIAVYKSIFNDSQEATQVNNMTIHEFTKAGGRIELLGHLSMYQQLAL